MLDTTIRRIDLELNHVRRFSQVSLPGDGAFLYRASHYFGEMEYIQWFLQYYPVAVDMVLYFFVFAAAARVGFAKTFPGHEGKILSVAVGLLLAAGLAMAQRTLGFSTEKLGPVAVFILCGVVFIAAYQFIGKTDVPKPLSILLSGLLALALARAAMPNAMGAFVRKNPLTILIVLGGLVYWAWQGSSKHARQIEQRAPGNVLARSGIVPGSEIVRKESRYAKKRIKGGTREDRSDEKSVRNKANEALTTAQKQGLTPGNKNKVATLVERVREKTRLVRLRHERLAKLDIALARFDVHWLRKAYGVNWSQLTSEQQATLKQVIVDERRELHTEGALSKLEEEMAARAAQLDWYANAAAQALRDGNSAGVEGWLVKVLDEEKRLEALDNDALALEKRLIGFLKDQRHVTEKPL